MMKNIKRYPWLKFAAAISSVSFLLGLSAFAYMGSFMRLIGDDYFLAANLKSYGFWGAQKHAYFNHVYFHGNRFGQTFILTFFSLFPPIISGILPLFVIIVFVATIYVLITAVLLQFNIHKPAPIRLIFSLMIAFFTLYLAPTVTQGLYWRSSMVSSFGTHVGAFILGTLILWKRPLRWYWFLFIFLYALFNAGLSENGAAFQAMLAVYLIIFSSIQRIRGAKSSCRILLLASIMLCATIIAITIMWKSPGIMVLKRDISISFIDAIILSFYHLYNFVKELILSKPLDMALIIVLGMCLYFLILHSEKDRQTMILNHPLLALGLIFIIQIMNMGFIYAIMLPSAYTRNTYPDPRHLIGAVFVFVFALMLTGYCTSAMIHGLIAKSKLLSSQTGSIVSVTLLMIISLFYLFTAVPKITVEHLKFKYWSLQWDLRHDLIVQAALTGEQQIHVLQMDHIIENVSELTADPNSPTYNEPASIYYGITIIADQPGWDEGFIAFRDLHNSQD